ncbi:MAG: DUF1592 domain-containing protein [Nannocystaceae bacterium]
MKFRRDQISAQILSAAVLFAVACTPDQRGEDELPGSSGDPAPDDDDDVGDPGDDDDDDNQGSDSEDTEVSNGGPEASCEETKIGPRLIRRLTRREIANTMIDVFPEFASMWGGVLMAPDSVGGRGKYLNDHSLKFGKQTTGDLLSSAEDMASLVASRLETVLPCAAESPDENCADELIDRYGYRLFRRPLSSSDKARYLDLFATIRNDADFETAVKWVLVALIESPHTVYRRETGEATDDGYRLTQFELASALAYTFSNSAPDAALLERAARGDLADGGVLIAEAKRLLTSERGKEVMIEFFRGWIHYDHVVAENKTNVPEFVQVREAMIAETEAYINEVIYAREGTVQDLLTASYTVVDPQLAQFYGMSTIGDSEFVVTQRDHGLGLLALGSVLASRSQSVSSSPTQRGLLVLERLLCGERIDPPQEIPEITPPEPGEYTTRERYETLHAADPLCKSCHSTFDPMGFGFEHWDEAGRYRADESGLEIDASGDILLAGSTLGTFDDQEDMAQTLAELPQVIDCVGAQAAYYAFGGIDDCLASQAARDALRAGEMGLLDFVASLVHAPHFVRRK